MHINGNAIYYVNHPWLRWLSDRLEAEADTAAAAAVGHFFWGSLGFGV